MQKIFLTVVCGIMGLYNAMGFARCVNGHEEAQIIAKITELSRQENACNITVEYRSSDFFKPNIYCPLEQSTAEGKSIFTRNCNDMNVGDTISGILVYDGQKLTLE